MASSSPVLWSRQASPALPLITFHRIISLSCSFLIASFLSLYFFLRFVQPFFKACERLMRQRLQSKRGISHYLCGLLVEANKYHQKVKKKGKEKKNKKQTTEALVCDLIRTGKREGTFFDGLWNRWRFFVDSNVRYRIWTILKMLSYTSAFPQTPLLLLSSSELTPLRESPGASFATPRELFASSVRSGWPEWDH